MDTTDTTPATFADQVTSTVERFEVVVNAIKATGNAALIAHARVPFAAANTAETDYNNLRASDAPGANGLNDQLQEPFNRFAKAVDELEKLNDDYHADPATPNVAEPADDDSSSSSPAPATSSATATAVAATDATADTNVDDAEPVSAPRRKPVPADDTPSGFWATTRKLRSEAREKSHGIRSFLAHAFDREIREPEKKPTPANESIASD
ncbi:MAG: hypothetical protein ABIR91_02595 [Candidatus Saccharimonadales bacterium]